MRRSHKWQICCHWSKLHGFNQCNKLHGSINDGCINRFNYFEFKCDLCVFWSSTAINRIILVYDWIIFDNYGRCSRIRLHLKCAKHVCINVFQVICYKDSGIILFPSSIALADEVACIHKAVSRSSKSHMWINVTVIYAFHIHTQILSKSLTCERLQWI